MAYVLSDEPLVRLGEHPRRRRRPRLTVVTRLADLRLTLRNPSPHKLVADSAVKRLVKPVVRWLHSSMRIEIWGGHATGSMPIPRRAAMNIDILPTPASSNPPRIQSSRYFTFY